MSSQHALRQQQQVLSGRVSAASRAGDGIISVPFGAGGGFTGRAYVAGVRFDDLNSDPTLPWVACDASVPSATEIAGPPPAPWTGSVEYFEKSRTYGDIHVSRL